MKWMLTQDEMIMPWEGGYLIDQVHFVGELDCEVGTDPQGVTMCPCIPDKLCLEVTYEIDANSSESSRVDVLDTEIGRAHV